MLFTAVTMRIIDITPAIVSAWKNCTYKHIQFFNLERVRAQATRVLLLSCLLTYLAKHSPNYNTAWLNYHGRQILPPSYCFSSGYGSDFGHYIAQPEGLTPQAVSFAAFYFLSQNIQQNNLQVLPFGTTPIPNFIHIRQYFSG